MKPNLLFLFADQQRADTVGAHGSPLGITPQLDALAADGVVFQQCMSPQPVCGPTRACLQSGLWATEVGCWRNHIMLPHDIQTLPRLLGDAGYERAYIGKWHLASQGGNGLAEHNYRTEPVPPAFRGGWDEYWLASDVLEFTSHGFAGHMFDNDGNKVSFDGQYRVDWQTDRVIEWLQQRDTERPFICFVSYIEPHHQNDRHCYQGPHGSAQRFAGAWLPADLERAEEIGDWRKEWADYLGCCESLDTNVGRIFDELRRQGIFDDTLIMYTADHGSHFCTRNSEYKRSPHDASIHVPCIIRGPGFRGGTIRDELVNLLDLPPTLLQAAGIAVPAAWAGVPLQQVLAGEAWRDRSFVQISESCVGRAIRTARWTYGVTAPDLDGNAVAAAERYVETWLYDNEADPAQLRNLVHDADLAATRASLRRQLHEDMTTAGETGFHIVPV